MMLQKVILVALLFGGAMLCCSGFDFHFKKESAFCSHIVCAVDVNKTDLKIFSVIGMSVFDVSQANISVKLASISVIEPDVYVDNEIQHSVHVRGNISQYHAFMDISLSNDTYCEFGSYLCELNFVRPSGEADMVQSIITSASSGNGGSSGDVSSDIANQLMTSIDQLTHRTENIEVALAQFTQRVDEKLDNITNLLSLVLDGNKSTLKPHVPSQEPQLTYNNKCIRGMANVTTPPRVLISLTGITGNKSALCDTRTDNGGWLVLQRRADGVENFYRSWYEYKLGFGQAESGGDYWLGNDAIHSLSYSAKISTSDSITRGATHMALVWAQFDVQVSTEIRQYSHDFELRIDMVHQGQKYYAQYSSFLLGNETTNYTLSIGNYTGDAGDSLTFHNNLPFSTFDRENDHSHVNCAVQFHGAWWYNRSCYMSNLNGAWGATDGTGINWELDVGVGLTFTEMKIRLVTP